MSTFDSYELEKRGVCFMKNKKFEKTNLYTTHD